MGELGLRVNESKKSETGSWQSTSFASYSSSK